MQYFEYYDYTKKNPKHQSNRPSFRVHAENGECSPVVGWSRWEPTQPNLSKVDLTCVSKIGVVTNPTRSNCVCWICFYIEDRVTHIAQTNGWGIYYPLQIKSQLILKCPSKYVYTEHEIQPGQKILGFRFREAKDSHQTLLTEFAPILS
jgi:hypothetical protein